jgi:prepilin-type N-terminal cleavage/methylation domain-containing protein
MDDNGRGFTLLELIIVVAVILTLLAISVPYLLHSKMAANENAARESLHTYNLVLFEYWTTYETYPKALANLGAGSQRGAASADLIDPVLASGRKSGYVFEYVPGELEFDGTTSTYNLTAKPSLAGLTGHLIFSMDQTGAVHVVTNSTVVTSSATP